MDDILEAQQALGKSGLENSLGGGNGFDRRHQELSARGREAGRAGGGSAAAAGPL